MEWTAEVVVEELIPEGWYLADFHSAERILSRSGPILTILFVVAEGEYAGSYATGVVGVRRVLRPGSKLFQWASALKGRRLGAGEKIDERLLQGSRAMIRTVPVKVDTGAERSFNQVQEVRPKDYKPFDEDEISLGGA